MALPVISSGPAGGPGEKPDRLPGLCRFACDRLRGNAILPWLSPIPPAMPGWCGKPW